jgi:hypothetical protein
MLCQTIFNFQFNEQDTVYIITYIEVEDLDPIKNIYFFNGRNRIFKYCLSFEIEIKPKLFRTGKMSKPGLKSIQKHETINNIIIDILKDIIHNIQINHSRIISGRFFKVDLLDREFKEYPKKYSPERFSGLIINFPKTTAMYYYI